MVASSKLSCAYATRGRQQVFTWDPFFGVSICLVCWPFHSASSSSSLQVLQMAEKAEYSSRNSWKNAAALCISDRKSTRKEITLA
jgi:hypothetical protein